MIFIQQQYQESDNLLGFILLAYRKPYIKKASKVCSPKGLVVHIFGRIAAAYVILIFNS